MTQRHNSATQPLPAASAVKRILTGAGIGLALIVFFLFTANEADPAWGKYWMIRPLVIVPLAGAGGGLFYHLMSYWCHRFGWNKTVVVVLCLLAYIIGLWLGTVVGLDGTYWN